MPERYALQRRQLILVRNENLTLSDDQKAILQSAINQLSMLEKDIDAHVVAPSAPPDAAKLNRAVSKHADSLTQLLAELKIKGEDHGSI